MRNAFDVFRQNVASQSHQIKHGETRTPDLGLEHAGSVPAARIGDQRATCRSEGRWEHNVAVNGVPQPIHMELDRSRSRPRGVHWTFGTQKWDIGVDILGARNRTLDCADRHGGYALGPPAVALPSSSCPPSGGVRFLSDVFSFLKDALTHYAASTGASVGLPRNEPSRVPTRGQQAKSRLSTSP